MVTGPKFAHSVHMERRKHKDEWRFFAQLTYSAEAVADVWCWAQVDHHDRIARVGSGFATMIAAMRDARSHGYSGPIELREPDAPLNAPGDYRRFLEILAA